MSSRHRHWLLCGGIGSGKSEVRRLLAGRGVHTIDADAVGHQVLAEEGFASVAGRWPEVVLEGKISREALARVVFADPGELASLEAITHPLIFGRIRAELERFPGSAVIVEVPVVETGLDLPRMVVDSSDELRVGRATARGMTNDDVSQRMQAQPGRADWLAVADLVIPNHGSLDELRQTVLQVEILLQET